MRYLFLLLFLGSSLCGMEAEMDVVFEAVGPLDRAVKAGDVEEAADLISKGFPLSSYSCNEPMWFAFGLKNADKREKMVKLLLKKGVDLNGMVGSKRNLNPSRSLLSRAVSEKRLAETARLLAYGADPNKPSLDDGGTALHEAATKYRIGMRYFKESLERSKSIMKLLMLSGANPQAVDSFGHTVDWLLDDNDEEMKDLLENFDAYRQRNPDAFVDMQNLLDEMRIEKDFERKVQLFGRRAVLDGTYRFDRPRALSFNPILPGYQSPDGAGKRKRKCPKSPLKPVCRRWLEEPSATS